MEEQKQSTSSNYFKGLSRRDYIQKAHIVNNEKTPVETKGKDIAYYTLVGFLLLSFLAFIYSAKY